MSQGCPACDTGRLLLPSVSCMTRPVSIKNPTHDKRGFVALWLQGSSSEPLQSRTSSNSFGGRRGRLVGVCVQLRCPNPQRCDNRFGHLEDQYGPVSLILTILVTGLL